MQMKENLDMESLIGQEMQLLRYKDKLKDYIANILKTYVDSKKKPESPQVQQPSKMKSKQLTPLVVEESMEERTELPEIRFNHQQEIEKLY